MTWDSAANSWNQAVLGYTQDRQRQLMRQAGIEDATWNSMATLMLAAAGIILARIRWHHAAPIKGGKAGRGGTRL